MSGPTHSNRNYKVMKGYSLPEGEYIIEEWNASNWDKETKERSSVPGAKDIKIYKKDPSKDYNKGDLVAFFRVFENKDDPQIPLHQQSSASEGQSSDIPF